LSPIPGASAKGSRAKRAITSVAIIDASAVAVKTPPKSIPAFWRVRGWTMRIYAIVRKVVTPAITSVLTSVPWALS
jgi:hypothetical protein